MVLMLVLASLATDATDAHLAAQRKKLSFSEVRKRYELAFEKEPASRTSEMRFYYAEVLWAVEAWREAAAVYREVALDRACRYAASASFYQVLAYEKLVKATPTSAARLEAIAAADFFLMLEPSSEDAPEVAYFAAFHQLELGPPAQAEPRLREVMRRWPKNYIADKAARELAELLIGERADARLIELSRELQGSAARALADRMMKYGEALESEGALSRAARMVEAAAPIEAMYRDRRWLRAGQLAMRAGEYDHAESAFTQLSEDADEYAEAQLLLSLLQARRRSPQAAETFQRAVEKPPEPEEVDSDRCPFIPDSVDTVEDAE